MKPRLYLETTIPSYLAARHSRDLRLAADQETTQEWWDRERQGYELFVSEVVLDEAADGDSAFAAKRLTLLEGLPRLRATAEVDGLVARLLQKDIIPPTAAPDAVHLALAAVHRIEYLLTWNCRHLHNPRLERRIEAACRECGFLAPVICTPAELLET
ncbi:MAG: type II toxin-antitoxin system VapC family toxin [Limisphaerales bacterium]